MHKVICDRKSSQKIKYFHPIFIGCSIQASLKKLPYSTKKKKTILKPFTIWRRPGTYNNGLTPATREKTSRYRVGRKDTKSGRAIFLIPTLRRAMTISTGNEKKKVDKTVGIVIKSIHRVKKSISLWFFFFFFGFWHSKAYRIKKKQKKGKNDWWIQLTLLRAHSHVHTSRHNATQRGKLYLVSSSLYLLTSLAPLALVVTGGPGLGRAFTTSALTVPEFKWT